jgi:acetyltransferase-like isoleucine patch superfamily enzyme
MKAMMKEPFPDCEISPEAEISEDARIYPSVRGTKLVIGAHTVVYEFAVIRAVGGMGDVEIGEHCQINPHCILYSGNGIKIGNHVLIAANTSIVPTNHSVSRRDLLIREQRFAPSRGGVVIEDDVWIGANCVLLDGTYIEKGAVIAAGSVVNRRVPAYQIWAGSPARFLKER